MKKQNLHFLTQQLLYIRKYSFKAYGLVYAIFIMLIISIITSSFIILAYFSNLYYQEYVGKNNQISNVNSGINLLLADNTLVPLNQIKRISLFGTQNDTVELSRKQWGMFALIKAKANFHNFSYEKLALSGNFYKTSTTGAIYIPNKNQQLFISGVTRINGDCYLSNAGIKKATIDGRHFEGNKLLDGNFFISADSLPELSEELFNCSFSNYKENFINNESFVTIDITEIKDDSLYNSFYDETYIVFVSDENELIYQNLEGNIVVFSYNRIKISAHNKLKDIIIVAPSIDFEAGFRGSLQAFASDTISIERGCYFEYPSVIAIIGNSDNQDPPYIYLGQGGCFEGSICCYNYQHSERKTPLIWIEETSTVHGEVYCNGYVEHKGNIFGSVYCEGFLLHRASGLYENYLLDATIDLGKLNKNFVGIGLISLDRPKKLVKWL